MKIKNLIWFLAANLLLAACTSEVPVDNKERVGLSVTLSVDNEATKAVGGEINPYFEEVQVQRYHVALFEGDKRIAHGEYGDGQSQVIQKVEGTEGITTKYKAYFKDIPEGIISVYVIANYPSSWDFTDPKWDTFTGYTEQSVVTDPFIAEELVKVGFETFKVKPTTTLLELSLVQLTAGIDLLLTQLGDVDPVEDPTKSEYVFLDASEEKVYDITDEEDVDNYIGRDVIINTISNYMEFIEPEFQWASALVSNGEWNKAGRDWFNRNNDFVYDKLKPEPGVLYFRARVKEKGNKYYNNYLTDMKIVAYGRDVDCDVKVPVKGLLTGETTLSGLNKESDIAIFKKDEPENTKYQPLAVTSSNTRFYTYEPRSNNFVLDVEVGTGENKNVYRKKYRQYGYKIYRGQWIDDPTQHCDYNWEGGAQYGFPRDAWLDVSQTAGHVIDHGTGTPIRTEAGDGTLQDVKTYSLTIPGSTIIKGHVYQVKGSYSPSIDVTSEISWQVIDMKTQTVNPDPFE